MPRLVLLLIAVAACADARAPLTDTFGGHARGALGDGARTFVASADGFVLPTADAVAAPLAIGLPRDGTQPITLSQPGFTIAVTAVGLTGTGELAGGHVRYPRGDGASYWSRAGDGFEEWLHVIAPQPGELAVWRVAGGRVEDAATAIAIVDDRGEPRIRVTAPAAFWPSGARARIHLEARDHSTIALVLDDAAAAIEAELLVDPLWATVGLMATPRKRHTASLLGTGKVLVAGGSGTTGASLATCELYDPASGQWTPAATMTVARYGHTATVLADGSVLVAGGTSGNATASVERYLPATNQWITLAGMPAARTGHTATLLTGGAVLVAGGGVAAAYRFTVATGVWSAAGTMAIARTQNTATKLAGNKVLVVGGYLGGYLASAEVYNETTNAWTAVAPIPSARSSHTATLLRDGNVLVAGGVGPAGYLATAYRYNPSANTWTAVGALATARAGHTAHLMPNDQVAVAGGVGASGYPATYEMYTPATTAWTSGTAPYVARNQHAAVLLGRDRVLVIGGAGASGTLQSASELEPTYGHDTWTQDSFSLPGTFFGSHTLLADGSVLLVGLIGGSFRTARLVQNTSLVDTLAYPQLAAGDRATLLRDGRVLHSGGSLSAVYDPATDKWTATEPMLFPRSASTATLLDDGRVLVVGGLGQSCYLDIGGWQCSPIFVPPELYDPESNTWRPVLGVPCPRMAHSANLLPDGRVVIVSGSDHFWVPDPNAEFNLAPPTRSTAIFDPATDTMSYGANLHFGRCSHTTTLLPDGRLLVINGQPASCLGNWGDLEHRNEISNVAASSWSITTGLQEPRYAHTATLLLDGSVLISGGISFSGAPSGPAALTVERFYPAGADAVTSPFITHFSPWTGVVPLLDNRIAEFGGYHGDVSGGEQIWHYDEGRQASLAATPMLTTLPASAQRGTMIAIGGTGFKVDAEATQGAATNLAHLLLIREGSRTWVETMVLAASPTYGFAILPATMLRGMYQARVVVNGTPSTAMTIFIE